jgi:NAD(P)-dependent dehydrogenase (short-subunit alcohol dehydrogenase family)
MKNAKVYLAARSPEKAVAAIERLEEETKKSAIYLQLDLADLSSVRKASETFLSHESRLDILFNNGSVAGVLRNNEYLPPGFSGVMICPTDQLTAQNYDLRTEC